MFLKSDFSAVVQARMDSSRLPGKVLKKINGKPILWHLIARIKKIKKITRIIVSTSKNKNDNSIVEFCKKNGIDFFRGSQKNCLKRISDTVKKFKLKTIVFITGDCPIIDYRIINQAIKIFENHKFDYVGNSFIRSFPDGMDVQIFKEKTIFKAEKIAKNRLEKEHVTLSIKRNPKIFKIFNFVSSKKNFSPNLGLTLDYVEDLKLIKKIINFFYSRGNYFFSCSEIISLLKKKKNWIKINENIIRKGDT